MGNIPFYLSDFGRSVMLTVAGSGGDDGGQHAQSGSHRCQDGKYAFHRDTPSVCFRYFVV